jgi:hypothetical protein
MKYSRNLVSVLLGEDQGGGVNGGISAVCAIIKGQGVRLIGAAWPSVERLSIYDRRGSPQDRE